MATSMNPVELYHDPSLDGIITNNDNLRRQGSSRRKSGGQDRRPIIENPHMANTAMRMPPAPEVPRGPPISYRGPVPGDPGLQRSFSQRAKGRPYAKEAFAEEETYNAEPRAPASQVAYDTYDHERRRAARPPGQPPANLHLDTANVNGDVGRRTHHRDITPVDVPASATRQAGAQRHARRTSDSSRYAEQPISAVSSSRYTEQPLSAVNRSNTLQDGVPADNGRDWAPDRSPLQKLEVTLNDISKEEKRARVQEAEMLLRESKATRGASATSQGKANAVRSSSGAKKPPPRREPEVVTEKPTIEDAGLVRNLSNTQRNRLQHSTTVDRSKPDTRRLSGEGRGGFDYSPTQPHSTSAISGGSKPRRTESQRSAASRSHRKDDLSDLHRSASGKSVPEADRVVPISVPSNITRAVSMQNQRPQAQFPDDPERHPRELAERERNASHKAALARLTGAEASATVPRSGSRKLQKAPPADLDQPRSRQRNLPQISRQQDVEQSASATAMENNQRSLSKQVDSQPAQPNRYLTPVNRGVQASPQFDSPQSIPNQMDVTRQRQRKSSVSFKEPANRRPVDDWKEAGIARLSLADFSSHEPEDKEHSKAWWEQNSGQSGRRRSRGASGTPSSAYKVTGPIDDRTAEFNPRLYLRCGPLLRYTGMRRTAAVSGTQTKGGEFWRGSVMIVTQDSHSSYEQAPVLRLFSRPTSLLPPPPAQLNGEELAPEYVDPLAGLTKVSRIGRPLYVRPVDHLDEEVDLSQVETDEGLFESSPSPLDVHNGNNATTGATNKRSADQDGEHLGRFQEVKGARLYSDPDRDVTFWRFNLEVELGEEQQHIAYRINRGAASGFWVPARGQTMNIMFHTCNGFSLSVNPNQFSGPDPLWRDVLNVHQTRPFHVMIGGGDQIYNDRVMTETRHFGEWSRIRNPTHKHHAPFTPEMKEELETFYLNRYAMWFSQGLFGMANGQIPMVNMWDDHDIIDGFGSYPDHFMKTPVFSGVGNVAFKYYMLFQHQSVPEETTAHEPSWVLGHEPGPFIHQLSRSVFMHMGRHVAFVGIDCRTERMRAEILSVRTLDNILERCRKEITEGETKHLILLLGVPIAYPRLVWLENVLTSRAMDPVKALGRVGLLKGGFLNKFDGGVEILDDLDDHWTASHHKSERNDFIKDMQDLAAEKSVRITILGGDVHLAAMGQFYSNPKLKIPKDRDHRYMPNIISSAIVNTPPPDMLADILNKRNKTHHLDRYTDEDMIPMFTHDVNNKKRNNKHLLPRRNWCSIQEYVPGSTPPPTPPDSVSGSESGSESEGELDDQGSDYPPRRRFSFSKDDVNPRALFRRMSSRNAPPTSYRDNMDYNNRDPLRSSSFDGVSSNRPAPFPRNANGSGSQATSVDSQQGRRASSFNHTSSGAPVRPGFMRRPTNLSEKAAKKGNVLAIDAEGNEFDVNDHINLEGGLDIVLNVEVNQKDPAGITTPYRLLVPALWYDGSSDREKLDEASGVQRKPALMNRFGIGGRKGHNTAQNQGAGNWGQDMSETESDSGSEDMQQKQPPRRRFSLFGNWRQRKDDDYSDSESEEEDPSSRPQFMQPPQSFPQQQPPGLHAPPAQQQIPQQFQSAAKPRTVQKPNIVPYQASNMRPGHQNHDPLYDTHNPPPPDHNTQGGAGLGNVRRSLTITSQKPHNTVNTSRSVSDTRTAPASAHPSSTPSAYERQADFHSPHGPTQNSSVPQRSLSKQERLLGIGASNQPQSYPQNLPARAQQQQQQQQQQQPEGRLRDNGFIGRNFAPTSPNAHQNPYYGGYSGVEAYSDPKPRRGFSFRAARNWLDGRQD